jgi:hypothetical protein
MNANGMWDALWAPTVTQRRRYRQNRYFLNANGGPKATTEKHDITFV